MTAGQLREEQIAEEWLQDWIDRNIAYLSAIYEPPWHDAQPPQD